MNLYAIRSDDPSVLGAIRTLMLLGAPLEVHLSDDPVNYPGTPYSQYQNHEVTFIQRGDPNMYTSTAGFLAAYPMIAYADMKRMGMIGNERHSIDGATITAGSLSEAMSIVTQKPDPDLPKPQPAEPPPAAAESNPIF